ncbi:hypothetical protein AHMF7605_22580 [Adhaeribacter arboris]|uniref:Uncharacterized protein n=1 Tax=Adhaeribacter arboris TaxID=2072846 RepID=A0A2T2YKQ7_9BACT|nr:hypothetical protein [Adhaeribacter arboris]PSR56088.1 hypothetical protein AHMF7605_22580 [Adhaeribacter arboris]
MQTLFFIQDTANEKGIKILRKYDYQVKVYPGLQVSFESMLYIVSRLYLDLDKDGQCVELIEQ